MINRTLLSGILSVILCLQAYARQEIKDTLLSVGNHQLHFRYVTGKGTPVIFESGNGDSGEVWEPLLAPIHEETGAPLITYDRAGLGKSTIDTTNTDYKEEVKNLYDALKQLGFDNEFFLVSHSFGGVYATEFANNNDVTGAVMIDIALPCFFTPDWSGQFIKSIKSDDWNMIKKLKPGLFYVLKNLVSIAIEIQNTSFPGNIPLTLIAAENPPGMLKPGEILKWRSCQESFGSANGHRYVLAKNASHQGWVDSPQLVINEIVELYLTVHDQ